MYVRFVLARPHHATGQPVGLFHSTHAVAYGEETPEWLRDELWEQLGWFGRHLPIPDRFVLNLRRRPRHGQCWFRPEAVEHIARAHYTAWLLREAGHHCEPVRARRPGVILYRDPYQVVAVPDERLRLC